MLDSNLFLLTSDVVNTYVRRISGMDFLSDYLLPVLGIICQGLLIYALILLIIALRIYIRKNR